MSKLEIWVGLAALCLAPAACDDEVTNTPNPTTSTSTSSSTGTAGSGGTGGGSSSSTSTSTSSGTGGGGGAAGAGGTGGGGGIGDCTGPSDCPGGSCVPVPDDPGGYWTCVYTPQTPTTQPSPNPGSDECHDQSGCNAGCDCFLVQEVYPGFVNPHTQCFCDECQDEGDCADPKEMCVPAGAWGMPRNQCRLVECKVHDDCTAAAGGICVAYLDACSSLDPRPFAGKYCHYDDDPCLVDGDCTAGFCIPDWQGGGFICGNPACPG